MSSLESFSLTGKVALVTGSSRSIGAAIVTQLASQGANVVVNYVSNAEAANGLVNTINAQGQGKAVAVQADTSTISGGLSLLDATITAFGRLDILVLNAGVMGMAPLEKLTEGEYDRHFNLNVKVPLFMAQKAVTLFPQASGGRLVFLSSSLTAASGVTPPYLTYLATKGAIEQISRVLSKELAPKGITVNTISPGPVDTPLFMDGKPPQVIEMIKKQIPQGRLGMPQDIAPIVGFLASPGAAWVNGQNIRVNGAFVV